MTVDISPETLSFQKPFTFDVVKCELKVSNSGKDPVVFKIKTTAPKTYCVRPNAGLILPDETKIVQVLLQPMEQDPADDFKPKDKFLIMSIPVKKSALDTINSATSDIWAIAENNASGDVIEKKLRVAFLPAPTGRSSTSDIFTAANSESTVVPKSSSAVDPSTPVSSVKSDSVKSAADKTLAATASGNNRSLDKSAKYEQALKEKEEEIKRLQSLAKQYKQASAQSSPSILIIIIVAIVAYILGTYLSSGGSGK